jgi:hypothetical protein
MTNQSPRNESNRARRSAAVIPRVCSSAAGRATHSTARRRTTSHAIALRFPARDHIAGPAAAAKNRATRLTGATAAPSERRGAIVFGKRPAAWPAHHRDARRQHAHHQPHMISMNAAGEDFMRAMSGMCSGSAVLHGDGNATTMSMLTTIGSSSASSFLCNHRTTRCKPRDDGWRAPASTMACKAASSSHGSCCRRSTTPSSG